MSAPATPEPETHELRLDLLERNGPTLLQLAASKPQRERERRVFVVLDVASPMAPCFGELVAVGSIVLGSVVNDATFRSMLAEWSDGAALEDLPTSPPDPESILVLVVAGRGWLLVPLDMPSELTPLDYIGNVAREPPATPRGMRARLAAGAVEAARRLGLPS